MNENTPGAGGDAEQAPGDAGHGKGVAEEETRLREGSGVGGERTEEMMREAAATGRVLGHYELIEEIAQGGMGVVFKARHLALGHMVALKELLPDSLRERQRRDRFLREARLSARLRHPNIVPLHDFGTTAAGRNWFTMDLVEGEVLTDRIGPEGVPVSEACRIVETIARAVHYAHTQGVIHRDLKPGNIMIDASGTPLIMDFGVAKQLGEVSEEELTSDGTIVGSLHYMSPEQAGGRISQVTTRSDVYSLGAILYELVTGRRPFVAENEYEVICNILHEEPVPPRRLNPHVSVDLQTIILKCLEKNPAHRYPSAEALADDLRRYLNDETIFARPAGPILRTIKFARRNRLQVTAAGLVTFALVAALLSLTFVSRARKRAAEARAESERRARETVEAEARVLLMEKQRREEWLPVCDFDFSRDTKLDPRFEVVRCLQPHGPGATVVPDPGAARIEDGALVLEGTTNVGGGLAILRWTEDIGTDIRIEVEVPTDQTFGLALAGDSLSGYRVIVDSRYGTAQACVELDTIRGGVHKVYARSQKQLDHTRASHRLVAEKVGQSVRVWLDDRLHIDYFDPVPLAGADHRTFGLSVFWDRTLCRSLSVWRRRSPELVHVLEPGREMMRRLHFKDAESFFREQTQAFGGTGTGLEAELLLGLALQKQNRQSEALVAFRSVARSGTEGLSVTSQATDAAAGIHARIAATALTEEARTLAIAGDFRTAVSRALAAYERDRHIPAPEIVLELGVDYLKRHRVRDPHLPCGRWWRSTLTTEEQDAHLALLAPLPVRHWSLVECGLDSVEGLRQARPTTLRLTSNNLTELSALQYMPLKVLRTTSGCSTLAPLKGMSLEQLGFRGRVTELSLLTGMPIKFLRFQTNRVADISPLRGMPLRRLMFPGNRIRDLGPLAGMRLRTFWCQGNDISSVAALQGMPINELMCQDNRIAELAPLAGMPLHHLSCDRNQIADLTALRGMPLDELFCGENPLRDLRPLTGLPLRRLDVRGIPLTPENARVVRSLPLTSLVLDTTSPGALELVKDMDALQYVNDHTREHFERVMPDILRVLKGQKVDLRHYADRCGGFEYLAVPVPMTWQAASDFARGQGGYLACPSTGTKWLELRDCLGYVSRVRPRGEESSGYHTGAVFDAQTKAFTWQSGEAWSDVRWGDDVRRERAHERGAVSFWLQSSELLSASPEHLRTFIIEWPARAPETPAKGG